MTPRGEEWSEGYHGCHMLKYTKAALQWWYYLWWSPWRSSRLHAVLGTTCSTQAPPLTPLYPIACRIRPLAPPKSQRRPLLLYKLSRASSSPHFDLPKSTLLTYILPASYSASQFNRGASFCALKLLRTIQSLVGYILPSHQFLHSIPSCFLIPTYWLSLLLHLNTSHAHTSAAFNHRH
jgi:hypothetical protein